MLARIRYVWIRDRYASIKASKLEENALKRNDASKLLQGLLIAANDTFSNSIMRCLAIQIFVTWLILNSCSFTKSPLIPHPSNATEVDTGDSKFAVGVSILERAVLELPPEAVAYALRDRLPELLPRHRRR